MNRIAAGWLTFALVTFGLMAEVNLVVAQKAVSVSSGWVKLPAPGETMALAFANVDNPTMYDIYLVTATADIAGKVEFREMGQGGDAKAQPVKELTVPAYGSVLMSPKGVHLVLIDLKRPLKEGDTVSLTFTNEMGEKFRVSAVVRKE